MNGRSAPPASAALTQELHDSGENDGNPFSPRIRTLIAILAKLRPEPEREPLPAPKAYGPQLEDAGGSGFLDARKGEMKCRRSRCFPSDAMPR
jgi:hypothetical protein